MPLDIRGDHLEIIQNILQSHIPNCRIVAFGSRIIGKAKKASDLDLCVMGTEKISLLTLSNLRDEFSLSNLPYKVDIIDWSALTPEFQKIVLKNNFEIQKGANTN